MTILDEPLVPAPDTKPIDTIGGAITALINARDYMDKHGATHRGYSDRTGRVCPVAALNKANGSHGFSNFYDAEVTLDRVIEVQTAKEAFALTVTNKRSTREQAIYAWYDHVRLPRWAKKRRAIKAFNKTIKTLESQRDHS